jgi:RHS repeat-associated protein
VPRAFRGPQRRDCAAWLDVYDVSGGLRASDRVVTNSTGTVCYDSDFYPFGDSRVYTNNCPQNIKYAGMEQDSETGFYHTQFRQYYPSWGRWLSPDPLGGDVTNPQSFNRYAYVMNNPANFTDPQGLRNCPLGQGGACGPSGGASIGGGWRGGGGDTGPEAPTYSGACGVDPSCNMTNTQAAMAAYDAATESTRLTNYLKYLAEQDGGQIKAKDLDAFKALHPNAEVAFGLLQSVSYMGVYGGMAFDIHYILYGYYAITNGLQLAGREASSVASPWMPVLWYGGSATIAVGGAAAGEYVPGAIDAVNKGVVSVEASTSAPGSVTQFLQGLLTSGPVNSLPGALGRIIKVTISILGH